MRFVWIPMQWSLLWKRRSSAPVQMSLGIHFCSRSPPKIRQQRKHLLNRSDTVSLFLSLSHSLSLSLSFIHAKTSAKLWSFQVKLLSVRLYILKSLSSPNASNTAFLPHYFCTSLIYMIKIKKNIQMGESHETCHKHIPVTFHSNQMKKKTWNSILQVNLKSVLRTIFFNAPKNRPHNFSRDFGGKMWHEIDSNPYLIFTTIEILVLYSCCIGYSCLSYIFNWKK